MRSVTLLIAALLLASCGGRQPGALPAPPVGEPQIELPGYVPAAPAFRIDLEGRATERVLTRLQRIDDVVVAAPVSIDRVPVAVGNTRLFLKLVAVEPLAFRSVAPGTTQEADFVWTALLGGRAVVTPDAAGRLGIEGSGIVKVRGTEISVGAFADNGVPNLGDVMIPEDFARGSGLRPRAAVVVGTEKGADLDRIRAAIVRAVDVRAVERLQPKVPATEPVETPDPVGTARGSLIGTMSFRIRKDGFIEPDPAWISGNIATGTVPILGSVVCHRILFPQLASALAEIQNEGLAKAIKVKDFGGCYVPRFIARDPRRSLSMHAFGLALDLNVSGNYFGTRGTMDPQIVSIFEKWGFAWGGRWSLPDPMHFELSRLIDA